MPTSDHKQTPQATRRGFFEAAIFGMMGLISAALAAPAVVYLFSSAKDTQAGDVGRRRRH